MRAWVFQDPMTPIAEGIMRLHHEIMVVMVTVVVYVGYMMMRAVREGVKAKEAGERVHGTTIEIVWTMIPAGILGIMAVPSMTLLYAMEEVVEPGITVKVIGHQWYWTYEIGEEEIEFDAYMIGEEELEEGMLRTLECDNRLVIPVRENIRMIITSGDVLHSWAVPAFGVKVDACPGRLNQVNIYVKREGVAYGQCSELCGVGHAYMPIAVEVVENRVGYRG